MIQKENVQVERNIDLVMETSVPKYLRYKIYFAIWERKLSNNFSTLKTFLIFKLG